MSKKESLSVVIDNDLILQFDRDAPIPGLQRRYLDRMDEKMSGGIPINGEHVEDPGTIQRAQFVANSLVNALETDNDEIAAASCSWLATRLPDLLQVKVSSHNDDAIIDLVFDKAHTNQVDVKFDMKLN